jgi:hypothetical protein
MAVIPKPNETVTHNLQTELTARTTFLRRVVSKDPATGFYSAEYPIEIDSEEIAYEVDAAGNRIDIYNRKLKGNFTLDPSEVMALWGEVVTLQDGTHVALGELVAGKIDAILAARFYPSPGGLGGA